MVGVFYKNNREGRIKKKGNPIMIKVKMKTYIKKVFNTINTFAIQRIYVKQVFLSLSRDYIIKRYRRCFPTSCSLHFTIHFITYLSMKKICEMIIIRLKSSQKKNLKVYTVCPPLDSLKKLTILIFPQKPF